MACARTRLLVSCLMWLLAGSCWPPDVASAAFFDDLDGDGEIDLVDVCDTAKVCVVHPSGKTSTYGQPEWKAVEVRDVADTDGAPGAEVIVLASDQAGRTLCVCVIHDGRQAVATYHDAAWRKVTVPWLADTDGEPGAELVLLAQDAAGGLVCVCIVRDRTGKVGRYADGAWHSAAVNWIADTDGAPGAEVIVEAKRQDGSLACLCVVRDAEGRLSAYLDRAWGTVTINQVTDTDGLPGAEILLTYVSDLEQGVAVIREAGGTSRSYALAPNREGTAVRLQHIGNYDGEPEQELCVALDDRHYELITDEAGTHLPVEDCATPLVPAEADETPSRQGESG